MQSMLGDLLTGEKFNTLWEEDKSYLASIARKFSNNPDDAEDLLQKVYIRASQSFETFRGECKFKVWVYNIIRSEASGERKKRRVATLSYDDPNGQLLINHASDDRIEANPMAYVMFNTIPPVLSLALAQLPERDRAMIILADVEEKSYEEIADKLNITIGTVKSGLSRARGKVRKMIPEPSFF